MGAPASLLIVDDDSLVRRALTRVFHRYGVCTEACSAADAEHHITSGATWSGFVIDVCLGDGSGLDVLKSARRFHNTPALIISGSLDRDAVNRAAAFNARFVCKPCGMRELAPFVADVIARTTGDRVYAAIERARHHWRLTPREAEILDATLRGRPRDEYVKSACISVNTYKTHVHRLLEKVDYESLSSLAIDLLAQD
jgi:DNA-binding NarL/FixJ family response regulator